MRRTDYLKASPPMFQSRWLDRFTRVHHLVPVVLFVPAIIFFFVFGLARAGLVVNAVALVLGGYVTWTLFEYWLHRVVFHFEPEKGVGARLHWMIHGVHHDHPNDPMRLVMPPSVSIPLAIVVCGVMWLILGSDFAPSFISGFLLGYLVYDELHYHLHHRVPKTAMGRKLRELHMRHHFQDEEKGFGISAPYWDAVFRTLPEGKQQKKD